MRALFANHANSQPHRSARLRRHTEFILRNVHFCKHPTGNFECAGFFPYVRGQNLAHCAHSCGDAKCAVSVAACAHILAVTQNVRYQWPRVRTFLRWRNICAISSLGCIPTSHGKPSIAHARTRRVRAIRHEIPTQLLKSKCHPPSCTLLVHAGIYQRCTSEPPNFKSDRTNQQDSGQISVDRSTKATLSTYNP